MKYRIFTIACAIVLASCASNNPDSASSYSSSVEKTDIPGVACSDIEYRNTVTNQFPEIAQACRGVIRDASGTPFVKVNAVVHNVRQNPRDRSVQRVTLDMLDANDASLQKISLQPPRSFRFTVDGKEYTAKDLVRGTELRMYLPTDRWEVTWDIDTATPLDTRVYVEDIDTYLVTATLEADDAFAFDSAELTAKGQAGLDEIVNSVGDFVPAISIFGYTDKLGDKAYNLDLSQRRAESVRDYLVTRGAAAGNITAKGYGEADPLADNKTAAVSRVTGIVDTL